ncbi:MULTISPECIES: site-specific DNA-methyltransferase [Cyanophyceae]|uniref:site-specific DNA-methyltransferase n=1 Tax=Cyanophyceae TaxID=3028117 RepID=UPI00016DCE62|nr:MULTISPECIES: site-specific DNA-methyltransferase [Cyanophyceae]ACB00930.1 DNA methylase [Picosynechococcus sp. PCC 7002]SMH58104.1 adenine-specific DNA-methyltransferase [Picosynechococcus sp. OG1]SMQ86473.1 adenine-specific DNA-methyltransferase [Synechococcus sp. 7002]
MAKKSTKKSTTKIESVKHSDHRKNIPTDELKDFMSEEQRQQKSMLYPRDTSLDPQLVWKGKDEQDSQDLAVPTVPIYIQEEIHPHAIIENFRQQVKAKEEKEADTQQLDLFGSSFEELDFEQQIDFYNHDIGWSNRMILGDSLLVMNSLAEKEGLKGKVQCIYLDPPYGIKFGSNWQVSTLKRDVKDGNADNVTRQPEQVKAFRDTWELGIHSYLAYLRDRLVVARELLTETGSCFVQIGDENVHLVRCLMDEVFGSDNFINLITVVKTTSATTSLLSGVCDYVVWYAKEKNNVKYRQLFFEKKIGGQGASAYNRILLENGLKKTINQIPKQLLDNTREKYKFYRLSDLRSSRPAQQGDLQSFEFEGIKYNPGRGTFKTDLKGFKKLVLSNRLESSGKNLNYVRFIDDFPAFEITNNWSDLSSSVGSEKIYVVQGNPKITERCILMATDPGDLVLDPTCGSGTTAYVAEEWGRRWITIDTSRVALALARTRLMSAKFDYYLLADSEEGITKEAEIRAEVPPVNPTVSHDIRKGFVYKRVPHITLKAIANNEEIDVIYDKWQAKLEPIRAELNKLLGKKWEEWEIPREPDQSFSKEATKLLEQWWQYRISRQKEIDDSIARNADYETLYDQPYTDNKRIRVTGRFTVESLSPHRVLSADVEAPKSEDIGTQQASEQFETRIIENLRKAGVQNTKKGEKLKFDNLEPYAGVWLQAEGEYTDNDGQVKRVAVSIGSEYGTVGSDQIKEAAKEAIQGLGYDLLIICGFAFDPGVNEESTRYGKLQVLITKMNPDLMLGEELLKKTGAGNLFMVFGEPDIEIQHQDDGKITVELKGLDIYDPTTGEIRSSSPDKDIACWFIDTDYNGESFYVRHAYFTGAGDPYKKLKKTLKAEIDEDLWEQLYSPISRPFPPPKGKGKEPGKIAVKVINHYGDEVLKIYSI